MDFDPGDAFCLSMARLLHRYNNMIYSPPTMFRTSSPTSAVHEAYNSAWPLKHSYCYNGVLDVRPASKSKTLKKEDKCALVLISQPVTTHSANGKVQLQTA
jgi:hypothetical protein